MSAWTFLSKWLPQIIYPYNLVLWLLLVALLLRILQRPRLAWATVISATFMMIILSSLLPTILYRNHENIFPPSNLVSYPVADAIVILSGDVRIPSAPGMDSQLTGNRVLHGFRLYIAGKAPIIIVAGGNVYRQNEGIREEAHYIGEILVSWGVPEDAIIMEGQSRNTYENSLGTKLILDKLGLDKILLVTSALHMPRAAATFSQTGLEVIPSPSDYSMDSNRPRILEWWPTLGNMSKAQDLLHEVLGIQMYRLRGWLSGAQANNAET